MSRQPHPLVVFPKVVAVGAGPVKEVGVVVNAPAHEAERIVEAVVERLVAVARAQVPLADVRGRIARGPEHIRQRALAGRQACTGQRVQLVVGFRRRRGAVVGHPGQPRIAARQQARPRGRTDRRRRIELRETHSVRRQGIHPGGNEVFGAVTSGVNAALVIREYDDDIGLSLSAARAAASRLSIPQTTATQMSTAHLFGFEQQIGFMSSYRGASLGVRPDRFTQYPKMKGDVAVLQRVNRAAKPFPVSERFRPVPIPSLPISPQPAPGPTGRGA